SAERLLLTLAVYSPVRHSFFCQVPSSSGIFTLSLHDALPIFRGLGLREPGGLRGRGLLLCGVGERAPADVLGPGAAGGARSPTRSEEHTSELQSRFDLVCRLLLEKNNNNRKASTYTPATIVSH